MTQTPTSNQAAEAALPRPMGQSAVDSDEAANAMATAGVPAAQGDPTAAASRVAAPPPDPRALAAAALQTRTPQEHEVAEITMGRLGAPRESRGYLMSVHEVAVRLGVSDAVVRRECASGRLLALRVGRLLRVIYLDYALYVAARRTRAEVRQQKAHERRHQLQRVRRRTINRRRLAREKLGRQP